MQSFLRRHRNNSGLFPISEVEEQRRFKPDKKMGAKEQILLTMLQDKNADNNPPVNFVITDPDFIDNPIIYASDGFCAFTGYHKKEIEQYTTCCSIRWGGWAYALSTPLVVFRGDATLKLIA